MEKVKETLEMNESNRKMRIREIFLLRKVKESLKMNQRKRKKEKENIYWGK